MKNQMTRECLYHSIKMEDELYHHGVLGMSWGDRNGPPYPLSGSAKKIARAEAKKKIEQERRLKKMRKMAAKKRKEAIKIQKKKEKILKSNDLRALQKNKKLFTNEEIQYATERNQALLEAKYAPNIKNAPDPHAGEKLLNIVTKLGAAANSLLPVVNLAKGFAEIERMNTQQKVSELDRRDGQLKQRYDMLRQSNPRQAVELLNKTWGTNYTYDDFGDKIALFDTYSKKINDELKANGGVVNAQVQDLIDKRSAITF